VPTVGIGKGKGKFHPRTGHEDPESYSSTLSLTSKLEGRKKYNLILCFT